MRHFLVFWLGIFFVSCQALPADDTTVTKSAVIEKTSADTFKPIASNHGSGYSWHKHFEFSGAKSDNEHHNQANINQAESMIESLNYDPLYRTVMETVQKLTNGVDKWLVYQNWAGPDTLKVGFAISNDGSWNMGVIDYHGNIVNYSRSSFDNVDFKKIMAVDYLKCAPFIVHGYTMSISIGSKGNQKDYNFNDEAFFQERKCASEKKARDLLNKIAKLFVFGESK